MISIEESCEGLFGENTLLNNFILRSVFVRYRRTDKMALILRNSWENKSENILNTMTDDERLKMREIEEDRSNFGYRSYSYDASLVLDDFLFLGDRMNAGDRDFLNQYEIKHIINVCDIPTDDHIVLNFNVISIPMSDLPETNIKQHFDRTNNLLHSFYEKGERCLVHCAAGISRSATIVLAYLMKYHHRTLREAHQFLRNKRPQISPNDGFLLQLIRYEKELIQSREIPFEGEKNDASVHEENPIETIDEFKQKHHIVEEKDTKT